MASYYYYKRWLVSNHALTTTEKATSRKLKKKKACYQSQILIIYQNNNNIGWRIMKPQKTENQRIICTIQIRKSTLIEDSITFLHAYKIVKLLFVFKVQIQPNVINRKKRFCKKKKVLEFTEISTSLNLIMRKYNSMAWGLLGLRM